MTVESHFEASQPGAEPTLREVAAHIAHAFEVAGSLDRSELVRVLEAHGAPPDLIELVHRRVPMDVRIRDLDSLCAFVPEFRSEEDAEPRLLQIGEVAERVGLSLRTVRYYEEVGLVRPSARTEGGFRLYAEEHVRRLLLVKQMKALGLSLDEMRELLDLLERSDRAEELDAEALGSLVVKLQLFAERGDDRIARLERDLEGARLLRLDLSERLGRSRSAFERSIRPGGAE